MSAVVVLAPIVVASWPILVSAVVSAAAAAGFRVLKRTDVPLTQAAKHSIDYSPPVEWEEPRHF